MLPEAFVNLSSLHLHGNKEVCFSEAALGWMQAHLTALGGCRMERSRAVDSLLHWPFAVGL